jgi:hypothetical protein
MHTHARVCQTQWFFSSQQWLFNRHGRVHNRYVTYNTRISKLIQLFPSHTSSYNSTQLIHYTNVNAQTYLSSLSMLTKQIQEVYISFSRSQWLRCLGHRSSAACLLRLWVRIPLGSWMSVCCECCVLSGRGLCDRLITHPEESYRLWRIIMCDQ